MLSYVKWIVSLLCFLNGLFATSAEIRLQALERKLEEMRSQNGSSRDGMKLQKRTFERGWVGAELFAGPIYYRATVGGTEYIYRLARGKEKVSSKDFDGDFGFRVGIGAFLPIVKWEVLGTYTHFGIQDTEGKGEIPPSLLVNLKGGYYVFSEKVKSTYRIDYDGVDLSLKRSSFIGSVFGLGSSLGAKKVWIHQDQRVSYTSRENARVWVKDRCCFEGIGPLLGMNLKLNFFWNLSVLGDVKFALLYSDFQVKHTESPIEMQGEAHLFSPNLSFSFGINKAFPFGAAQGFLTLLYEADYFFRQNQMVSVGSLKKGSIKIVRSAEDLTFYGIATRIGIEF